jgi:hypothetical protein
MEVGEPNLELSFFVLDPLPAWDMHVTLLPPIFSTYLPTLSVPRSNHNNDAHTQRFPGSGSALSVRLLPCL